VVAPEVLEDLTGFNNALFLGSVNSASVDEAHLQPGGGWVTVTDRSLVLSVVHVVHHSGLWAKGEGVSSIASAHLSIEPPGFLGEIPGFGTVLPSLND